MNRAIIFILLLTSPFSLLAFAASPAPTEYFRIHVVDSQTRRGIPLVELETTNSIRYYTDSNGLVAFYEPGLMDQEVFFSLRSHGYDFKKDGFGMAGSRLKTTPGGTATLEMTRINIAERLYRITGGGIYRDTVLLGDKPPIRRPLLNGRVFGQDSTLNTFYNGRLYWFWGDTGWPAYPLGNFNMTGATTLLPKDGGLDPDVGVDLEYILRDDGFTREMVPMEGPGPTWAFGFVVLKDAGRDRMFAGYAKIKGASMETYRRGLAVYNDEKGVFQHVAEWPLRHPIVPTGHADIWKMDGRDYVVFQMPLPIIRVPAARADLSNLSKFEVFTCLKEGSTAKDPQIDGGPDGRVRYAWKRNTAYLGSQDEANLVKSGKLKPDEVLFHLRDADSGKSIIAHAGHITWNDYRKRWTLIDSEIFGTSMLGEIWYAEADSPLGPWVYARKVLTHDKYSFYNPKQHPYFAKEGGRIIYFEGTYTESFSGAPVKTPRYDYNQIMYRLDLADARLVLPVPVYELSGPGGGGALVTKTRIPPGMEPGPIVFFAPDRPGPGLLPVYEVSAGAATKLQIGDEGTTPQAGPRFYALPTDTKNPPATTLPLIETIDRDGHHQYATTGEGKPVCLIWHSPVAASAMEDGRYTWKE